MSEARGRRARRAGGALLCALLGGCAAPPPPAPAATGPLFLRPRAAPEVEITTHGQPRPQYRAPGVPGQPMPYEDSVSGGLVLCAGLGPLFGPCAGVMIGTLAVAGVTTSVVDSLADPPPGTPDAAGTAATLAADDTPETTLAASLGARIAAGAVDELRLQGREVGLLGPSSPDDCGLAVDDAAPARRADVDIVALELEFEPGYQYHLAVVARVRVSDCGSAADDDGRRLAWRSRLRLLSRDADAARRDFEAELDAAVATLGRSLAAHLSGPGT